MFFQKSDSKSKPLQRLFLPRREWLKIDFPFGFEKGSFQKVHFLEILQNLEML